MNRFAGRRGTRAATAAAMLIVTAGLAGCSENGVMHNGNVGATDGDNTVSTSQVEQATTQIQATTGGQSSITAADIIPYLVLAPKLDALGSKYGAAVSNQQIEQAVHGAKLSPATLDAYRANVIVARSQSQDAPEGMADAVKKIMMTKITVNPRFGAVSDGQAANSYVDWERYQQSDDDLGGPNGHPMQGSN